MKDDEYRPQGSETAAEQSVTLREAIREIDRELQTRRRALSRDPGDPGASERLQALEARRKCMADRLQEHSLQRSLHGRQR
jgi:hypothetical protein